MRLHCPSPRPTFAPGGDWPGCLPTAGDARVSRCTGGIVRSAALPLHLLACFQPLTLTSVMDKPPSRVPLTPQPLSHASGERGALRTMLAPLPEFGEGPGVG